MDLRYLNIEESFFFFFTEVGFWIRTYMHLQASLLWNFFLAKARQLTFSRPLKIMIT